VPSAAESVWDYPRPPSVERTARELVVVLGGLVVARSVRALRVLETSHAPTYFFPPDDVHPEALREVSGRAYCEWKGFATYYDVVGGPAIATRGAYTFLRPTDDYRALAEHVAFFPALMDLCTVDGHHVKPEPAGSSGGSSSGWLTKDVVGLYADDADSEEV
jgi:uncharacterized protein (DUF427 family)